MWSSEDFLSISGRRSRGNVAAATKCLEKKFPCAAISEMVVKNAIVSILKNELDAEELVKFILSERDAPSGSVGSVEYPHLGTNNGALDYCAWSSVGSRMVVETYGRRRWYGGLNPQKDKVQLEAILLDRSRFHGEGLERFFCSLSGRKY